MAIITAKRPLMTVYSDPLDFHSHQIRIALAEKGVVAKLINVDPAFPNDELLEINPYHILPTVVDRDLVIYKNHVIMEYLDERFPHPPLLPAYPVARAKFRLMIFRIERDWSSLVRVIQSPQANEQQKHEAKKDLVEGLLSILPIFKKYNYFMGDEFSLLDCCVAPILWRLPYLGIELPLQGEPIERYARNLFERESFKISLSDEEKEMREAEYAID